MTVDNFWAYLDAIYHTRHLGGTIVEIGVAYGGTATAAATFEKRIGGTRRYVCIDTFDGFVTNQLETDHRLGLSSVHDRMFGDNSMANVRRNLRRWDAPDTIELVKADICEIDSSRLPGDVSLCLLDVDLRDPIYCGLEKLHKKLAPDGLILVDDCKQGTSWVGADTGYRDFMKRIGRSPKYYMGFGVLHLSETLIDDMNWKLQDTPMVVPS